MLLLVCGSLDMTSSAPKFALTKGAWLIHNEKAAVKFGGVAGLSCTKICDLEVVAREHALSVARR